MLVTSWSMSESLWVLGKFGAHLGGCNAAITYSTCRSQKCSLSETSKRLYLGMGPWHLSGRTILISPQPWHYWRQAEEGKKGRVWSSQASLSSCWAFWDRARKTRTARVKVRRFLGSEAPRTREWPTPHGGITFMWFKVGTGQLQWLVLAERRRRSFSLSAHWDIQATASVPGTSSVPVVQGTLLDPRGNTDPTLYWKPDSLSGDITSTGFCPLPPSSCSLVSWCAQHLHLKSRDYRKEAITYSRATCFSFFHWNEGWLISLYHLPHFRVAPTSASSVAMFLLLTSPFAVLPESIDKKNTAGLTALGLRTVHTGA